MGLESIIGQNRLETTIQGGSKQALGKDDFLNLMMRQLQMQDPLNPMDNQAMISQMAQFSSLEQMSNLNTTMSQSATMGHFMEATTLLGKDVQVLSEAGEVVNSTVKSVSFSASGPLLTMENGATARIDQLVGVSEPGI